MEAWAEPAATVAADLDRGRAEFATALRSGDSVAAAAAYAPDATLVAPAGELLHGRTAIERFWRTGVEIGIGDVELAVLELRLQGDLALEIGEYVLHLNQGSGPRAINRGRYLVVMRAEPDGQWRRTAEMFSPDDGRINDGR